MEISRLRRHLIAAVLAMLLILVIVLVRSPPANAIWMKEGQIVKLKNVYEGKSMVTSVEFIDIGGSGNRTKLCGFLIDGDQLWVEEGNDRELKGERVYVRDHNRVLRRVLRNWRRADVSQLWELSQYSSGDIRRSFRCSFWSLSADLSEI